MRGRQRLSRQRRGRERAQRPRPTSSDTRLSSAGQDRQITETMTRLTVRKIFSDFAIFALSRLHIMADSLGYEDDFEEQSEHPSELSVDFFEETIESARIPPPPLSPWIASLIRLQGTSKL